LEERELVKRAKQDIQAFDELYRIYYPKINNFVFHRTYDEDVRNEIVSNVFYKAMKNLYRFKFLDSHRSSFSSWLYRIAVSEINQYYRDRKRDFKLVMKKKNDRPDDPTVYPYEFKYVKQCLSYLTPFEQNLVALKYFEKKSYRELSEIFGKKENALKVKMHRSMKKLKNILEQEKDHGQDQRYA